MLGKSISGQREDGLHKLELVIYGTTNNSKEGLDYK
jgi:hypothetical protein